MLLAVLAAAAARAATAEHECALRVGLDEQAVPSKLADGQAARKSYGLVAALGVVASAQETMEVSTWCSTALARWCSADMVKPSKSADGSLAMHDGPVSDGVLDSNVLCKLAFKTVCRGLPEPICSPVPRSPLLRSHMLRPPFQNHAKQTKRRPTKRDFSADRSAMPRQMLVSSALRADDGCSGRPDHEQAPRGVPEPQPHAPSTILNPDEEDRTGDTQALFLC